MISTALLKDELSHFGIASENAKRHQLKASMELCHVCINLKNNNKNLTA